MPHLRHHHDSDADDRDTADRPVVARDYDETAARDRFGGVNTGACFFGWLVAIGLAALLTGIIAAIASAVGVNENVGNYQEQAQENAGTVGIVSAIVLIVVLLIGYYAGGYVAGRMSRFDGTRQGVVVWLIGLIITILAVAIGWIAGDQYNVLDRVDLPRIPIPQDELSTGGIITGIIVLVGTLLAAMAGGAVGRRYHDRVDREAYHTTI